MSYKNSSKGYTTTPHVEIEFSGEKLTIWKNHRRIHRNLHANTCMLVNDPGYLIK